MKTSFKSKINFNLLKLNYWSRNNSIVIYNNITKKHDMVKSVKQYTNNQNATSVILLLLMV